MISSPAGARRVVVVTGSPRSGTTAVGDLLALAPGTMTLYEPLNRTVGDRRVTRYFEIPGGPEFPAAAASELARDVVRLRLRPRPGIFPTDPLHRKVVKRVTGSRTLASYRRARLMPASTLIWKDPFAIFWLDFLERELEDVASVVTYRPPLAVAASFARLEWRFRVADVVARMHSAGAFVHPDAERFIQDEDMDNWALNGAATWALCYGWYANTALKNGILVDARSLAQDPAAYEGLYDRLGLAYTANVGRRIARTEDEARGRSAPDFGRRAHTKHRNLATMNSYYTTILTADDQGRIERGLDGIRTSISSLLTQEIGAAPPRRGSEAAAAERANDR